MDQVRCFIALDLPPALVQVLRTRSVELAQDLASVRWVKPENHHLTLQFLGDVDVDRLAAVTGAVDHVTAGHGSLRIRLDDIGGFPGPGKSKVIWQGITGAVPELSALQSDLAASLAEIGFERDSRPFQPHLTLGRSRRPVALPEYDGASSAVFELSTVSLIRSELDRRGARYTGLHTAVLKKCSGSS